MSRHLVLTALLSYPAKPTVSIYTTTQPYFRTLSSQLYQSTLPHSLSVGLTPLSPTMLHLSTKHRGSAKPIMRVVFMKPSLATSRALLLGGPNIIESTTMSTESRFAESLCPAPNPPCLTPPAPIRSRAEPCGWAVCRCPEGAEILPSGRTQPKQVRQFPRYRWSGGAGSCRCGQNWRHRLAR